MTRATAWTPASQTVVCRTPLLPIDGLLEWGRGPREELEARLRAWIAEPIVQESLRIASPSLAARLGTWLDAAEGTADAGVRHAAVRYLTRMASRATPFGLCATYTVGRLADHTRLELAPRERIVRHVRLDAGFVAALVDFLQHRPAIRQGLAWRPNTSLHRHAGARRMIESVRGATGLAFRLVTLDETPHLSAAIDAARGATLDELADRLLAVDASIAREDVLAYLDELATHQVLVPDLQPPLTGPGPFEALQGRLALEPQLLATVEQHLHAARAGHALPDATRPWPFPWDRPDTVQVDAARPAQHATLDTKTVAEVARGLAVLARLPGATDTSLDHFAATFERRHGTRELPLLEALDEASGAGFRQAYESWSSPLLAGIAMPTAALPGEPASAWAVGLYERALRGPDFEVRLTDDDLAGLPALAAPCSAMMAMCEPYADGSLHLRGALGPSAGRLWSRFAQADAELRHALDDLLRREEALEPDVVHAEVVHLPDDRVANILARPVLRAFEIPLLARSGTPEDRQLALDDLWVRVVDGRVRLRSRRLGRDVVPHLTTAFDADLPGNLALYRFLGALEAQGRRTRLAWSWGVLDGAARLPRVVHGRTVLAPARWRLDGARIRALAGLADGDRQDAVQALSRELGLPRLARLAQGDHELFIDFGNPLSVGAFVDACRTAARVELVEDLAAVRGPVVTDGSARYCSEWLVPFLPPAQDEPAARVVVPAPTARRRLLPGSECLYLKAYGGQRHADTVLRRLDPPDIPWFFVRYADPDPHLRLRFFGEPRSLVEDVLPRLGATLARLEDEGLVWKVQVDTYEREVERYGGPQCMELVERWFCVDSRLTRDWLCRAPDADEAWRFAVGSSDALLSGLGLSLAERLAIVQRQRRALAREAGFDAGVERHLSDQYRARRPSVEQALATADAGREALRRGAAELAARLREAFGALPPPLVSDLLHMHLNRIFFEAQRVQEAIVCDHMARAYRSVSARLPVA